MKTKHCPICKIEKDVSAYDQYFSKERNKLRFQNYCRECMPNEKRKRSIEYYNAHKKQRLQYAKMYREKNTEIIEARRSIYKKRQVDQLQDCYVVGELAKRCRASVKEVRQVPGLIGIYKAKLKLKRKLKSIKK